MFSFCFFFFFIIVGQTIFCNPVLKKASLFFREAGTLGKEAKTFKIEFFLFKSHFC